MKIPKLVMLLLFSTVAAYAETSIQSDAKAKAKALSYVIEHSSELTPIGDVRDNEIVSDIITHILQKGENKRISQSCSISKTLRHQVMSCTLLAETPISEQALSYELRVRYDDSTLNIYGFNKTDVEITRGGP
ncbi:MAG: hypothetical protein SGJ18_01005 [Pseudomonadota bacterium]|nr:hypothetical protein [Pseudomonadota bacterium]